MTLPEVFLQFPEPQHSATFLTRPQRFLAGVSFSDGHEEFAYFANPGSMSGCLEAGCGALVWDSQNPKRTRRYTLRAVKLGDVWVGTDTQLSNRIVERALKLKLIPGLESYDQAASECLLENGVRIDFLLSGCGHDCLVEVKSAMVVENSVARYPDSVTPRGVRQLKALSHQARLGKRVVLLFVIQRADAQSFVVTSSVDDAYALAFNEAVASGVQVLALSVTVDPSGFSHPKLLPYAHQIVTAM